MGISKYKKQVGAPIQKVYIPNDLSVEFRLGEVLQESLAIIYTDPTFPSFSQGGTFSSLWKSTVDDLGVVNSSLCKFFTVGNGSGIVDVEFDIGAIVAIRGALLTFSTIIIGGAPTISYELATGIDRNSYLTWDTQTGGQGDLIATGSQCRFLRVRINMAGSAVASGQAQLHKFAVYL